MNERCMRILDMVREAGSVEVSALAEALGVSAVTIRKDLAQLEKERLLRRQHGSAVQISSDDVAYRMAFDYGPKRRIAQRAAAMVQNGETVMIESGSTCALLAAELAEKLAAGKASAEELKAAASEISDQFTYGSNMRGSAEYRHHLGRVLLRRCMEEIQKKEEQ